MTTIPVSVAMIVRDEAPRLARLLPALSWAAQVVVLDGGSADATRDVARAHGAHVYEHPFDNFAAQRNRALDLAQFEWVLSLDADEQPTRALVAELARLVRDEREAAYRVPIRSRIFGRQFRFSGTQDDRPVRLFRRTQARWHGAVHERLIVAGRIGQTRGHLEHDTLPDVSAFLAKMHRYTALAVERRAVADRFPRRGEATLAAVREIVRRGVFKLGMLDGPAGWLFCLLSGLSAFVEVDRLRQRMLHSALPLPLGKARGEGVRFSPAAFATSNHSVQPLVCEACP